jgi:hypothetical protein
MLVLRGPCYRSIFPMAKRRTVAREGTETALLTQAIKKPLGGLSAEYSHGTTHVPTAIAGSWLALRAADVLASHLAPFNEHDAAAATGLIPALAAPAAVPAPVLLLKRAAFSQGAARRQGRLREGCRVRRVGWWCRIRGGLNGHVCTGPLGGAFGGRRRLGVMTMAAMFVLGRAGSRLGGLVLGRRAVHSGVGTINGLCLDMLARQRVVGLMAHCWGRRTDGSACQVDRADRKRLHELRLSQEIPLSRPPRESSQTPLPLTLLIWLTRGKSRLCSLGRLLNHLCD